MAAVLYLQVLLLVYMCAVCSIAPTIASPPSGKLLAMADSYVALFQIDLDGKITKLYNRSFSEVFFTDCQYALDYKSEMAYLPAVNYILGVDINSGKTVIKNPAPKPVYFTSFDYHEKNKTIYGVCTGNDQWNWCELTQNGTIVFKYQLPYCGGVFGPIDCDYDADFNENMFWYDPGFIPSSLVIAIDIKTGNVMFTSGPANTSCIAYDSLAKKVYAISRLTEYGFNYGVTEVHPDPKPMTHLVALPTDLMLESIGSCIIDSESRSFFVLMRDFYQTMPTALITVDLDSIQLTRVNLSSFGPTFQTKNFILNVKFIGD